MPAPRDPYKRVVKTFRLRPWLKTFDITRLARNLEHWSLRPELERDPPDALVREIGSFVVKLLRESMGFEDRTYRKPKERSKKNQ